MKKMCLVFVVCLVLSYSSVVCAADESLYPSRLSSLMQDGSFNESENVVFEDGNCTSGVFYCEWSYDIYHVDLSKVTGDHLYLVDSSTSSRYSYSLYVQGKCVVNTMHYYLTNGNLDLNMTTSDSFSSGSYGMFDKDVSMVKEFFTTIPIFKSGDTESINAYLNDNDCSGATNYDEIAGEEEYSDDVELPKNFTIVDGHKYFLVNKILHEFTKDVVIRWNQTVDTSTYKYDVDVSFEFKGNAYGEYVGGKLSLKGASDVEVKTPYISYKKDVVYNGSKNVTLVLSAKELTDLMYDYAKKNNYCDLDDGLPIRKLNIRVRNVSSGKCSNYVSAVLNFGDKTATVSETDEDGQVVDDAEYDNTDGTVSDTDGGGVSSNISIDGLNKYIRSGFGLLGDCGVISLMSQTFLFLPNSIWDIIKFFISVLMTISVLGAVVKIVF